MFPALRRNALADLLRGLIAAGGAALVLGLTVFAASPELHDQLHEGTQTSEESCPVTLFANGVSLPVDPVTVLAPDTLGRALLRTVAAEILLAPPRYLLRPERGPPEEV